MTVEETVARFFPAGTGYDHTQAKRLIAWLDSRGFAITPKDDCPEQVKGRAEACLEKCGLAQSYRVIGAEGSDCFGAPMPQSSPASGFVDFFRQYQTKKGR